MTELVGASVEMTEFGELAVAAEDEGCGDEEGGGGAS